MSGRRAVRAAVLLAAVLLAAVLLAGCRTLKSEAVRTEYRYVTRWDSVFVDCTDTLYVFERGDTVRIVETKAVKEYRYKFLKDTARVTDTVIVEKITTLRSPEAAQRKVRRWSWFCAGLLSAFLIIFATRILIKIYFKK